MQTFGKELLDHLCLVAAVSVSAIPYCSLNSWRYHPDLALKRAPFWCFPGSIPGGFSQVWHRTKQSSPAQGALKFPTFPGPHRKIL